MSTVTSNRGSVKLMDYYAWLESDEWKAIRDKRLALGNGRCDICRKHHKVLFVHHLDYRFNTFKTPIDYTLLKVVCKKCHRHLHFRQGDKLSLDPFKLRNRFDFLQKNYKRLKHWHRKHNKPIKKWHELKPSKYRKALRAARRQLEQSAKKYKVYPVYQSPKKPQQYSGILGSIMAKL